jgi:hypothetical protein
LAALPFAESVKGRRDAGLAAGTTLAYDICVLTKSLENGVSPERVSAMQQNPGNLCPLDHGLRTRLSPVK